MDDRNDEMMRINEELLRIWRGMNLHLATGFELLEQSHNELNDACEYMREFEGKWVLICSRLPESDDKERAKRISIGIKEFRGSLEESLEGWKELSKTFQMVISAKPFWCIE